MVLSHLLLGGLQMVQEIEIEYKNLLTKDEFNLLLENLPFPKESQTQINYYFETADLALQSQSAALRIRQKNEVYQLTLKEPHPEGLLETHDFLTEKEAFSWLHGNIIEKAHVIKQLKKLHIPYEELLYFGKLTTERREVNYKNVLIVLDISSYNGQVDYEFELEAPSRKIGIEIFNDLLQKNAITIKQTPNKIERFFSSL